MTKPPNLRLYYFFHNRCYPNFFSNISFLILFCLMLPLIQHNIFISTTSSLFFCWLFTAQHSVPNDIVGLIVVQYNFPLILNSVFITNNIETLLHFICLVWIIWFTSPSIFPPFGMMDSRYLNRVTSDMILSPIFTFKQELVHLLLNLHFIYPGLLLLKQKSCASKFCLHNFDFPFISFFLSWLSY